MQRVSACLDGEATDAELASLLQAMDHQGAESLQQSWAAYHVIGECLRGEMSGHRGVAPADFLAGIRDRLAGEGSMASVTSPASALPDRPASLPQVRGPAANDAVFRWKMVAGLASVAAVMAVTWGVIGSGPAGVNGPVMAQRAGEVAPVVAVSQTTKPDAPVTVAVETPRGTIIRDARLLQLLADHRQNGMSALQMPAGFLTNATHDNARGR
ncbi:MAG: sigma-E factor negative regulatory protein [Gammaproteobacteria bacterium]